MEQGFRGVKMKVGGGLLTEDVTRIKAVRAVIEPDAPLMVEANQALNSPKHSDGAGPTRISTACGSKSHCPQPTPGTTTDWPTSSDIPIATGENRYGQAQFRDLIAGGGVGIVQPDLRRASGLTDCYEIGVMAAGFGIPYASHGRGA